MSGAAVIALSIMTVGAGLLGGVFYVFRARPVPPRPRPIPPEQQQLLASLGQLTEEDLLWFDKHQGRAKE